MKRIVLAAWSALLACGWMDVQGPSSVAPPTALTVELTPASADPFPPPSGALVRFRFAPPAGASVCALEVSSGGAGWRVVTTFPAEVAADGYPVPVALDAPDGVELAFRAVCEAGALRSPASEEVRLTAPVLPATQVTVDTAVVGGVATSAVRWDRRSRGADRLELQRRRVPAAGEPGAWETLPLTDVNATAYSDAGLPAWEDGARFAYRVVYRAGVLASAPVEGVGAPGKPLPLGLTATAGAGGVVHVAWTYPGAAPVEVEVRRATAAVFEQEVATVPSPGRSLDDAGAPAGALVSYVARARLPGTSRFDDRFASDPASALVLVPAPAWQGRLQARLVSMPEADAVARGPAGEFALAREGAFDRGVTVSFPSGAGWSTFTSGPWANLSRPGVAFDAAGLPHATYEVRRPAASGDGRSVVHRWRDGGGEHEEEAAVITALGMGPSVSGLAADGVPQFLWQDCVGTPCATSPVRWTSRRSGAWSFEEVPAPWQAAERRSDVALDGAGRPAFVAFGAAGTLLLRRGATTWSATPLPPLAGGSLGPGFDVRLAFTPSGHVIVAYSWFAESGPGFDVHVLEHDGAAWLAPFVLEGFADSVDGYALALSPDGTRLAVVSGGPRAALRLRDSGAWRPALQLAPHAGAAVGFTSAGKAWALTGLATGGTPSSAPRDTLYAVYEEP